MNPRQFVGRVGMWLQAIVKQAIVAATSVPLLLRKPAIALHALATAWQAQVILLLSVLGITLWAPALVSGILEWLYPPKDVLFGLTKRVDGRLQQNYQMIMALLWAGSGAVTLLAAWLHIPVAIASASRRSRALEQEADSREDGNSAENLGLYRKALALTSDSDHESCLRAKVSDLDSIASENTAFQEAARPSPVKKVQQRLVEIMHGTRRTPSDALPSAIGQNSRYRLESKLGHGGMGIVYRGLDSALQRPVAIKGLPGGLSGEAQFVSRFHQEAKALAFLSHPCIVQVYDLVECKGQLWIVLELVEGGDLSGYLARHGRLTVSEAARLGAHLADALNYAHAQGVVHRDFKPANVLLTPDCNPKITDFGLAKLLGTSTLTQSGTILGSPHYMSPEQASGHPADERSDAYAFGITLYELLTGRPPFEGDTAGVLAQHITAEPVPPGQMVAEIPPDVDALILSLLHKDPQRRASGLDNVSRILAGHTGTPLSTPDR